MLKASVKFHNYTFSGVTYVYDFTYLWKQTNNRIRLRDTGNKTVGYQHGEGLWGWAKQVMGD